MEYDAHGALSLSSSSDVSAGYALVSFTLFEGGRVEDLDSPRVAFFPLFDVSRLFFLSATNFFWHEPHLWWLDLVGQKVLPQSEQEVGGSVSVEVVVPCAAVGSTSL